MTRIYLPWNHLFIFIIYYCFDETTKRRLGYMWKYQCMHMYTQTYREVELKFEKDNVHVTVKDEPQVRWAKTYRALFGKSKLDPEDCLYYKD